MAGLGERLTRVRVPGLKQVKRPESKAMRMAKLKELQQRIVEVKLGIASNTHVWASCRYQRININTKRGRSAPLWAKVGLGSGRQSPT